jgi:hypothetical protein
VRQRRHASCFSYLDSRLDSDPVIRRATRTQSFRVLNKVGGEICRPYLTSQSCSSLSAISVVVRLSLYVVYISSNRTRCERNWVPANSRTWRILFLEGKWRLQLGDLFNYWMRFAGSTRSQLDLNGTNPIDINAGMTVMLGTIFLVV